MRVVLYYTVALAGAGKDTLYHSHYSHAVHVSSDAIREEVFGDVNDQSHNAEVFNIMFKRTVENLKAGRSVFYNATNLSAKRRIGFLKSIANIPNVIKICLLVVPPLDRVRQQNRNRDRVVPEDVIDNMVKRFEIPHKSEGWNDIRIYGNEPSNFCWDIAKASELIEHNNPHHSETIGNHMYDAAMFMEAMYPNAANYMMNVAHLHDVGKLFCRTYYNSRGEKSEYCHFYNHENVGAYYYISTSYGTRQDLHIANLIQHHMDYFKSEKYLERIRNRFGDSFMEELDMLHQADLMAH